MTERTCGECYRCCVAFGIRELKKHQDQTCRHLDGRNPIARCSIYPDRPKACREYICLWLDGLFNDEDRPDKSGVIAHCDHLNDGKTTQLVLTIDKDANYETMQRIHEWCAGVNIAQILYRTTGTYHLMVQGRDGTGISGIYVPVDYEGLRLLETKPIDFKEHADPHQMIVCGKNEAQ
jgi:Fe-S-cluster containining protein